MINILKAKITFIFLPVLKLQSYFESTDLKKRIIFAHEILHVTIRACEP